MSENKSSGQAAEDLTEQEQEALNRLEKNLDIVSEGFTEKGFAALFDTPLKENLIDVTTSMYVLLAPLDMFAHIINNDLTKTKSYESMLSVFAAKIAKDLGKDKAEALLNPETRTPEQQEEIVKLAKDFACKYSNDFENCNYIKAKYALKEEQTKYNNKGKRGVYNIKTAAALYFFATHPDILPDAAGTFTEEHKAELKATLHSLDDFFVQQTQSGKIQEVGGIKRPILFDYIEANTTSLQEQQEVVTVLQTIMPKYHIVPNNSLINYLSKYNAINAGAFDLPVINKKGKHKEITAYTIASVAGTELTAKLTEYERQVSDAIISIWVEAQKQGLPPEFTIDMVFRAMPGSGDKPSPQQAGAITKAIEKLRQLKIYVDVTEEMREKHFITDNETLIFDDMYLSAARVTRKIKNGGQTVRAYHIHTEPLILSYCKMTKQLITVPAAWLEVKKVKNGKATNEALPMTQDRQSITGYIMRRIALMKYDRKSKAATQSNVIIFKTLFEDIGIESPDKFKAADIRNFCFTLLDFYKSKGIINDYKKQTEGRSITGIKILM